MRARTCDRCGKEIPSKEKYIKCVEVGEITDKRNHTRAMNGIGDLCIKCWNEVVKK